MCQTQDVHPTVSDATFQTHGVRRKTLYKRSETQCVLRNVSDPMHQTQRVRHKASEATCQTQRVKRNASATTCQTQRVRKNPSDVTRQTQDIRHNASDTMCQLQASDARDQRQWIRYMASEEEHAKWQASMKYKKVQLDDEIHNIMRIFESTCMFFCILVYYIKCSVLQ